MNHETRSMLKARAINIREALDHRKVPPDQMTAAALLYLSLKMMKLPADDLIENLPDAIRAVVRSFDRTTVAADDPNGTVTLTNVELATLMNSKVGQA
jgi:hypothetical protein